MNTKDIASLIAKKLYNRSEAEILKDLQAIEALAERPLNMDSIKEISLAVFGDDFNASSPWVSNSFFYYQDLLWFPYWMMMHGIACELEERPNAPLIINPKQGLYALPYIEAIVNQLFKWVTSASVTAADNELQKAIHELDFQTLYIKAWQLQLRNYDQESSNAKVMQHGYWRHYTYAEYGSIDKIFALYAQVHSLHPAVRFVDLLASLATVRYDDDQNEPPKPYYGVHVYYSIIGTSKLPVSVIYWNEESDQILTTSTSKFSSKNSILEKLHDFAAYAKEHFDASFIGEFAQDYDFIYLQLTRFKRLLLDVTKSSLSKEEFEIYYYPWLYSPIPNREWLHHLYYVEHLEHTPRDMHLDFSIYLGADMEDFSVELADDIIIDDDLTNCPKPKLYFINKVKVQHFPSYFYGKLSIPSNSQWPEGDYFSSVLELRGEFNLEHSLRIDTQQLELPDVEEIDQTTLSSIEQLYPSMEYLKLTGLKKINGRITIPALLKELALGLDNERELFNLILDGVHSMFTLKLNHLSRLVDYCFPAYFRGSIELNALVQIGDKHHLPKYMSNDFSCLKLSSLEKAHRLDLPSVVGIVELPALQEIEFLKIPYLFKNLSLNNIQRVGTLSTTTLKTLQKALERGYFEISNPRLLGLAYKFENKSDLFPLRYNDFVPAKFEYPWHQQLYLNCGAKGPLQIPQIAPVLTVLCDDSKSFNPNCTIDLSAIHQRVCLAFNASEEHLDQVKFSTYVKELEINGLQQLSYRELPGTTLSFPELERMEHITFLATHVKKLKLPKLKHFDQVVWPKTVEELYAVKDVLAALVEQGLTILPPEVEDDLPF